MVLRVMEHSYIFHVEEPQPLLSDERFGGLEPSQPSASLSTPRSWSQQLQMASDLIDDTLRTEHSQHCGTSGSNLRPTSIVDDSGAQAETDGLGLKGLQFLFRLDLDGDLGLASPFPALEQRCRGRGFEQVLVTSQRRVRALSGDLTCARVSVCVT